MTPDYTRCVDDIPTHLDCAAKMDAEGDHWGAHNHYLRCSGLSSAKADKRAYEAKANEQKDKAISKMILKDRLKVASHVESLLTPQGLKKLGKPLEEVTAIDVGKTLWYSPDVNTPGYQPENILNANFWYAVQRIHGHHHRKITAENQVIRDSLPEGVTYEMTKDSLPWKNYGSQDDIKIVEILDWLKLDPPELIAN